MPRAGETPECLIGIARRTSFSSSCKTNLCDHHAMRATHATDK
ncbi:hypothetical protein C7S16_3291 [Burkholderia thailandensis]|uniref:Uncharacterized protein n=1 Tax=Burkholderia thailandensis TaxID=57975 RepID=A0AAW9D4Y9_BURTH|nr:hypothetical protein [Burkholderia thailandensis]MDW9257045.1 hypothetical protein [Burkholderia thailandensis]